MNSDRAVVFNVLFCILLNVLNADRCGPDEYLGAGCEHCGKLCDIPPQYPDSCQLKCNDYKPKVRGISIESTITTTAFVATPDNNNQTILYICLGIVALILSILLAILLCKRIRKSFKPFKRRRALKKLRKPVQPEHDPENHELNSLNDNSPDSVTGNLLGDIYETLNENGREYDDTRPDVRSPSSSTIETTATIESQASRGPASDDFSSGLPASNLSTGPSIGDGNSADRLNVSGELEEEEFV